MIKLCGFAASNYYNKVKLALLEKGISFDEELVWTDRSPALLAKSSLGKIPYLETDQGVITESQVIVEYLETAYPDRPLYPADPMAAAHVREIIVFMELYLELAARELFPEAFFGGKVSDEIKLKVEKQLTRNIKAFATLAKFSPFVVGESFTLADCAASAHLPLVASATKLIYGKDMLADLPVREYTQMLAQRDTVQKVNADRKLNLELMMQRGK